VDALPQIIDAVVSGLLDALPQLIDAGVQLFVAIVQNLPEIIKGVVAAIPKIIKAMVDTFTNKDNLKKLADAGLSLVKGLWNGISDATSWIKEKIGGFASGIVDSIKDFFGIHSPSRVFRDEVGRMLALGVGEGFADEMKDVRRDMEDEIPTNVDTAVNAAWGAMAAGPTDIFDLTIPFMVGAEKITTQVSRIQYNRQTGQARVLGVTTS
jgi:flagellar biosynthesis protein FliQ